MSRYVITDGVTSAHEKTERISLEFRNGFGRRGYSLGEVKI